MATNSEVPGDEPLANHGRQGNNAERVAQPPLPDECRATELDWTTCRAAMRSQAWRLCALSLGLRPATDIAKRLRDAGLHEALAEYKARKTILRANLTSAADADRLQYELHADGDNREQNRDVPATSRIVRLDQFYQFLLKRQLRVDSRFAEIAGATPIATESVSLRSAVDQNQQQSARLAGRTDPKDLIVGLLMMYLRDLAKKQEKPPQSLLIGPHERLNVQALADKLSDYVDCRTDHRSARATPSSGASRENIRKWLGKGTSVFKDAVSEMGDGMGSVAVPATKESGR